MIPSKRGSADRGSSSPATVRSWPPVASEYQLLPTHHDASFQQDTIAFVRRLAVFPRFVVIRAWQAILVCVALSGTLTRAQGIDAVIPVEPYAVRNWTQVDGLPQNSVCDIVQDEEGMLWIATLAGLARFDGIRFERFDQVTHPSLPSLRIVSLAIFQKQMWLGSEEGHLCRLSDPCTIVRLPQLSVRSAAVDKLVPDGPRQLWILHDQRLLRMEPNNTIHVVPGLSEVLDFAIDSGGDAWAGTTGGLYRIRSDAEYRADKIHSKSVSSVAILETGEVYTLGHDQLVNVQTNVAYPIPPGDRIKPRSLFPDHDGALWIQQHERSIRFLAGHWSRAPHPPSLARSGGVRCALSDRNGNLWFGTEITGLFQLTRSPLRQYNGNRTAPISAVAVDDRNQVWCGGQHLNVVRGDRLEARSEQIVLALSPARSGGVWVGTDNAIERWMDHQPIETIRIPTDKAPKDSTTTSALLETSDESLWIGTHEGFLYLRSPQGDWKSWSIESLGLSGKPSVFFEDRENALWIGAEKSVVRYSPTENRFTALAPEQIPTGPVRCFEQDTEGKVWFGSYGGGLVRIESMRETTRIDSRHGLYENIVSEIVPSAAADDWVILGNRAVSVYSFADLQRVADKRIIRIRGRSFDRGYNVDDFEGNGIRSPSGARDKDGKLWFPTTTGLVCFDPNRVDSHLTTPTVHVEFETQRGLVEARRSETVEIKLDPGERHFSMRLSAAAYMSPPQLLVRYRFDGLDSEWQFTDGNRQLDFRELEPGRFPLRVQAAVGDGEWSEITSPGTIVVPASLHETGWFQALLIGLTCLFAAGVWRIRSFRMRRRNVELARNVDERTSDLQSEIQRREGVEFELRRAGEELEFTVESRTQELSQALEKLKRDIDARTQAEIREREQREAREAAEVEKNELEQQLQNAQKLEAIGRLAGGIAHDFNNLLTAIIGNAAMLRDSTFSRESSFVLEASDEIQSAAQRAASLTRKLLTFSRREVVRLVGLDLRSVVQDLSNLLERLLDARIDFEVRLGDTPCPVVADPTQLEQILLNLVVNAGDAMPDGGRLIVSTEVTRASSGDARVCLSVSDTGHGMDPDTLARIFDPFFTTKPAGEGTGLGLSIVYGAVQRLGGEVDIETKPNEGANFRVYLPYRLEGASVEEPDPGPASEESPHETILVAEDDEHVRHITTRTLRSAGYHVLEAENGEQAIEVAAGHHGLIDLLVSDVIMPRVDGRELASRFPRAGGTKILFVSGYGGDKVRDLGEDLLQKPFTPATLLARVRAVLDRERQVVD